MGKLIKAISGDGAVICVALDSTDMVHRAEQIHRASAVVTAALGRLLTAASIMGSLLKEEGQSVTLRMAGGGPVQAVVAVSDFPGNVRGYVVNPIVELPLNRSGKLDVAGAIGTDGCLSVIRDLGMDMPQTGHCAIRTGEVAEDIAYYYATSEQIPTVCGLGVLVGTDLKPLAAGGYIVQLLPGAGEDIIKDLENNLAGIPPVSSAIHQGWTPQRLAVTALAGLSPRILEERDLEYRCGCSRDRVEKALIALGPRELSDMAGENTPTEVSCHFCGKKYRFSPEEIRALIR